MRKTLVVLAALCGATPPLGAQSLWMGPSGGGMLAVQEAGVIGPGHFAIGLVEDNYDRDPLGLDVLDLRIAWRLGVTRRLELYGRYDISRAVSVPGTQEVPPPPLDIVDLTGHASVAPPYRTLYWPMPYLGDEPADVRDMTDGEYVFGAKWLLTDDPDIMPHVSFSLETTVPGTLSAWKLRKGSGAGGPDVTATMASTWAVGRWAASANLAYTFTSAVKRDDLLITRGTVRELRISRADLLRWGAGIRLRICKPVSVMVESAGWIPVGPHTPMQDNLPNSDLLAGMELGAGPLALTVGVRHHLELQRHRQALPTGPLAGGVDLSAVPQGARRAWLDSIGAPPTRPDTNTVVLGVPVGVVPPVGARVIPELRHTNTTGNGAIIAAISLRF